MKLDYDPSKTIAELEKLHLGKKIRYVRAK